VWPLDARRHGSARIRSSTADGKLRFSVPAYHELRARINGQILLALGRSHFDIPCRGRSFAPKGKTPVRTILSQRRSVRFLSAISNAGTLRFMVLKKAIDAQTLITFFKRLCTDAGRKVFVILDILNVHNARAVKQWLADHKALIAVFYLPSYTPELNPDEYLNGDLKLSVAKRAPGPDARRTPAHRHRAVTLPAPPPGASHEVLPTSARPRRRMMSTKSWPK
jgi:DDE superfamily endonuclease